MRNLRWLLAAAVVVGVVAWSPFKSDPTPSYEANPSCSDAPCTSPDAGTDFVCVEAPSSVIEVTAGASASISYRFTVDPDGGFFASTADHTLFGGHMHPGIQLQYVPAVDGGTLSQLVDGGALVLVHLSAADPSAGVAHCP
jgi:hypothetical protein